MKKSHPTAGLRLVKSAAAKEKKDEVQVSVEITNDELTDRERAELIKGAKRLLQEIFTRNPDAEVVVVDDTHADVGMGDGQGQGKKIINFSEQKVRWKDKKR